MQSKKNCLMFGIFLKLCLCVHWGVNNEGWWQGTIRLTVLKPCAEWQDHHFSDNRWLHSLILPSCCCPCLVCFRQTLVVGPMSQKCSPTFLSFRHTWRLRSLFVISPWMPPSQQALFAQSLIWLGTEVPPSLPDPWTPADPLPPALHRPLPWMEIKAVLRFPLKRTLRAMRSLLGDCARTLGGPFASMLGGQSLMMVGVASRHCDPHCLGEVLGETLFEATLDPPSPSQEPWHLLRVRVVPPAGWWRPVAAQGWAPLTVTFAPSGNTLLPPVAPETTDQLTRPLTTGWRQDRRQQASEPANCGASTPERRPDQT